NSNGKWIAENSAGFFEGDTMFSQVSFGLCGIPLEFQAHEALQLELRLPHVRASGRAPSTIPAPTRAAVRVADRVARDRSGKFRGAFPGSHGGRADMSSGASERFEIGREDISRSSVHTFSARR